jgi:type III restriction enzyme
VEMLQNLNPCFIFDLTATPRKNSNIISYVSSIELKKEHMVKLPVIVYNNHETADVISNALQLQKSLEIKAKEIEDKGGRYIRPIVLFQAQPQSKKEENVTFEKIKEKLIKI